MMGVLFSAACVVVIAGAAVFFAVKRRSRNGEPSPAQRRVGAAAMAAIALALVIGLVAVVVSVVDTFQRRSLPPPEYASLTVNPDESLKGTIAYLSEGKNPTTGRQACARVAAASGAEAKDALCWPITESATATVVWQPDGRLLVTSFDAPVGEDTIIPRWATLVDVATGATEDVADDELGENARPSSGPATNPEGEQLVKSGSDGNVDVELVGPSESRTVFSVNDANPDWGIQTGPTWSPDFDWFLMWDGTRLLLTTVDDPTVTRVLADEASGYPYSYDVPNFSITGRSYPGS